MSYLHDILEARRLGKQPVVVKDWRTPDGRQWISWDFNSGYSNLLSRLYNKNKTLYKIMRCLRVF